MARDKRKTPEIPSGSMADIAFLLLIFFLVTTTIDTDRGLTIVLPPITEDPPKVESRLRNIQIVLVNSRDQLLVNDKLTDVSQLREMTKEFITNPHNRKDLAESPKDAIVSLRADRGTSYDMYIQVQNELKGAYNDLRDQEALNRFGKKYNELPSNQRRVIRAIYPQRISEAEPEDVTIDR